MRSFEHGAGSKVTSLSVTLETPPPWATWGRYPLLIKKSRAASIGQALLNSSQAILFATVVVVRCECVE